MCWKGYIERGREISASDVQDEPVLEANHYIAHKGEHGIDWEEKLEAVNVFRIKREARMPVFWHTYTAMPSERIA
jgi:hypothetical protein